MEDPPDLLEQAMGILARETLNVLSVVLLED